MRIHNLTDRTPPYLPQRKPEALAIDGFIVEAGQSCELPDQIPLARISGWIHASKVSVDHVPGWYTQQEAPETSAPVEADPDDAEVLDSKRSRKVKKGHG